MKRTNDSAAESTEPVEGGQAKRTKAEEGESYAASGVVEAPVDESAIKDETMMIPPAPMPADGSPLLPGEGTSISNDNLPPPPQLTQAPPSTLAELTIARANRNNAFEAAQHQLAAAVLRQNQAGDALNQCKFQQNAAMAELVRQQAGGFGMPPQLSPIGTAIPGAAFLLGGYNAPLPPSVFDVSNLSHDVAAAGVPLGGGLMDSSPYMALGGVVPFPSTTAAAAAESAMGPAKMSSGVPNYSLFMNPAGSNLLSPNTANFMSLSKEEQQNQLLALAKSTQTGVSTSKKHGPYIPGVVTRGDGFYDPGPVRELALPSDRGNLSEYQCLLRKQIVLFSVTMNDIQCSAQGRNKPIVLGQVGVLCRHCSRIPPGMRPCGAAYFPAKLSGLYQASQNMAINHFTKSCRSISEDVRESLVKLKAQKSTVLGGGKHFWANGAKVLGVIEMEDGLLRFKDEQAAAATTTTEAAAAPPAVKYDTTGNETVKA